MGWDRPSHTLQQLRRIQIFEKSLQRFEKYVQAFFAQCVQTFFTVCTNSNGRQTEGKRPTPLIHRDGLSLKHTMENETKIHENIYGRKTGLLGRLKYLSNTF